MFDTLGSYISIECYKTRTQYSMPKTERTQKVMRWVSCLSPDCHYPDSIDPPAVSPFPNKVSNKIFSLHIALSGEITTMKLFIGLQGFGQGAIGAKSFDHHSSDVDAFLSTLKTTLWFCRTKRTTSCVDVDTVVVVVVFEASETNTWGQANVERWELK